MPNNVTAQILPLTGDLCIAEVPIVRAQIDAAIDTGARDLVLDLADATLVTAAALRVFDAAEHRLLALGGSLRLQNPRPLARRVLEVTGFDRLLDRPASVPA